MANSRNSRITVQLVERTGIGIAIQFLTVHVLLNGFTMKGVIAIFVHRTKFEHVKFDSIEPYTLLTEKDGTLGVQTDYYCDDSDDNAEWEQNEQSEHHVEYTFCSQIARMNAN